MVVFLFVCMLAFSFFLLHIKFISEVVVLEISNKALEKPVRNRIEQNCLVGIEVLQYLFLREASGNADMRKNRSLIT